MFNLYYFFQIYLLAAPPSKFVTTVFRVHLNFLNGAVLAILFPVTNARLVSIAYVGFKTCFNIIPLDCYCFLYFYLKYLFLNCIFFDWLV